MTVHESHAPHTSEPGSTPGFVISRPADIHSGLTTPVISLIAFATALNLSVGQIAAALKLPLYLDMLGTVLCAVIAGFRPAATAAIASNILATPLGSPSMIFFVPVGIVVAGTTSLFRKMGVFSNAWSAGIAGILQGAVAAAASAPIAAYVFGGVTFGGADVLVALYRGAGFSLLQSTWLQGMTSDIPDKVVTYLLIATIVRGLPERILSRFRP